MNYPDYISYNIRSQFSRQPGQLTHCLKCGGILTELDIEPSETVRLDLEDFLNLYTSHDFSLLYICNNCEWWCTRESWSWNEYGKDLDYLIVGVTINSLLPASDTAQHNEKPWLKALADEHVYDHALDLPYEIAAIFPPTAKIIQPKTSKKNEPTQVTPVTKYILPQVIKNRFISLPSWIEWILVLLLAPFMARILYFIKVILDRLLH